MCEPFDLEMELDLKKVENWLAHLGLHPYTHIHASGHLNYDAIILCSHKRANNKIKTDQVGIRHRDRRTHKTVFAYTRNK